MISVPFEGSRSPSFHSSSRKRKFSEAFVDESETKVQREIKRPRRKGPELATVKTQV